MTADERKSQAPALEARDLTLSWDGERIVVQGVTVDVAPGEVCCLVGRSGCGKTTILHALAGLTTPMSGHVLLHGEDVTGRPGRVSYMLQKDLLLPSRRIIDNVCLPLVLSGMRRDEARAKAALEGLHVDEYCAELLPAQKPERAQALKARGKLMYVGDGINDTPVMTVSDVSVAMGGLGSDAAIEASDFVLATDSLSALPKAVKGARKTRKIVIENIVFSIAVKLALMALSLCGLLPLSVAVLGDTGVMLLAVLNSMRMRAKIK